MGLFRNVRKRHKIRVSGPAIITIESGRAAITVEADKTVDIKHDTPSKESLTNRRRPPYHKPRT